MQGAENEPHLQLLSFLFRAWADMTHIPCHPLAFPVLQLLYFWIQLAIHCLHTHTYMYIFPQHVTMALVPSKKQQYQKAALHKQIHHHLCILLKCYYRMFPFQTSVVRLIKSVHQLMQTTDWIKLTKIFAWPQPTFPRSFIKIRYRQTVKLNPGNFFLIQIMIPLQNLQFKRICPKSLDTKL